MRLRPPPRPVREWFRDDIQHESPEHVALWQDWFREHGIDPSEVLLTHWVERRDNVDQRRGLKQYQIAWLESGVRDGEEITVHREMSLLAPPKPFPVP